MEQWHDFWLLPAVMAGAVLLVFAVTFWDKAKAPAESQDEATSGAEGSDSE